MPDDITLGEVHRNLREHVQQSTEQHRATDSRITEVATQSVTVAVWQQAERARDAEVQRLAHEHAAEAQRLQLEHARDIAAVRDEIKVIRERGWLTTGRFVMIFLAVIALATLLVTAWPILRGGKQ